MDKNQPLFTAIEKRDHDAVRAALDAGADIHALSVEGQTVLHAAVNFSKGTNELLMRMLVDAGADVNARNSVGQTPMDYAMNAPHTVHYGRAVGPDGEPLGEAKPDETKYAPSCSDVLSLFRLNAKASDHEASIGEIRRAICGAGHFSGGRQHIDRNLEMLGKRLSDKKDPKCIPDFDAPAFDQNTDDPVYDFARCYNHMSVVASGIAVQNQLPALLNFAEHTQEKSWKEYAAKLPEIQDSSHHTLYSVRDLHHEFCKLVVGPALIRGLDDENLQKVDRRYLNNLLLLPVDDCITKALSANRSADQLIEMSESYHRQVTALHDKAHLRIESLEWMPLLAEGSKTLSPDVEGLEGWSIEHLTTGRELRDEGHRMQHCVGGYASSCMMGNSHIFSIRDGEGNSVSTIEIAPADRVEQSPYAPTPLPQANGASPYVVLQHYGPHNSPPSAEAERVLGWLKGQISSGAIELQNDPQKIGAQGENAAWKDTTVMEQLLYHYKDDMTAARQQELFDLMVGNNDEVRIRSGRRNYLVAPHHRKMPVEQFLEETGINKAIGRMCEMFKIEYTPPQPQPQAENRWQQQVSSGHSQQQARGI